MIKEAYCSFEVAKLLKEKGFDECIFEFYEGDKVKYARNGEGFRLSQLPDIYYPHITHQMACAWLREVHNIDIEIRRVPNTIMYKCLVYKNTLVQYIADALIGTYEEEVEFALTYVLKTLI